MCFAGGYKGTLGSVGWGGSIGVGRTGGEFGCREFQGAVQAPSQRAFNRRGRRETSAENIHGERRETVRARPYSPPTVRPSTRSVGAATEPRNSRSLAISLMLKKSSFRFPATVISSTG